MGHRPSNSYSLLVNLPRVNGHTMTSNFNVLFVDDKARNVEGAKLAGLDAFVFVSEEQFIAELRSRDLTIGALNAY